MTEGAIHGLVRQEASERLETGYMHGTKPMTFMCEGNLFRI
jgi:hypothetical protein